MLRALIVSAHSVVHDQMSVVKAVGSQKPTPFLWNVAFFGGVILTPIYYAFGRDLIEYLRGINIEYQAKQSREKRNSR